MLLAASALQPGGGEEVVERSSGSTDAAPSCLPLAQEESSATSDMPLEPSRLKLGCFSLPLLKVMSCWTRLINHIHIGCVSVQSGTVQNGLGKVKPFQHKGDSEPFSLQTGLESRGKSTLMLSITVDSGKN